MTPYDEDARKVCGAIKTTSEDCEPQRRADLRVNLKDPITIPSEFISPSSANNLKLMIIE